MAFSPVATAAAVPAMAAATVCGWHAAAQRRHRRRWAAAALVGMAVTVALLLDERRDAGLLGLIAALLVASVAAARVALRHQTEDQRAGRGRPVAACDHPVLLINPRSGDGKAERTGLAQAAERRGITTVVLTPTDDLKAVAERAVADGADALGMAGGDGSQALVARVAADHKLPMVCVPSGTRNHFAADLGLNRGDVNAALDGFGEAVELEVDLGVVVDGTGAGRVFVNNVVMGVYGRAVHNPDYRKTKAATLMDVFAKFAGPAGFPFRFPGPDGSPHPPPDLLFVGNNPYRLASVTGFGSRARLDTGRLGVVTVRIDHPNQLAQLAALELAHRPQLFPGWTEWSTGQLDLGADGPIEAGVDGEAVTLQPPCQFRVLSQAVRIRIPATAALRRRSHHIPAPVLALARLARGRPPREEPNPQPGDTTGAPDPQARTDLGCAVPRRRSRSGSSALPATVAVTAWLGFGAVTAGAARGSANGGGSPVAADDRLANGTTRPGGANGTRVDHGDGPARSGTRSHSRDDRCWHRMLALAAHHHAGGPAGSLLPAVVAIVSPTKRLASRPEPYDASGALGRSFPSGHTASAVVAWRGLAVTLWLLLGPSRPRSRLAAATIAATLTSAVAAAMLGRSAHWLSDIFAGACIGAGCPGIGRHRHRLPLGAALSGTSGSRT